MSKKYSLEAHVLHSGLQLVWKRLDVTAQLDGWQILVRNRPLFLEVSAGIKKRFGIICQETHMKEAGEMLHYAFQLNIPKSYYVIMRHDSKLNMQSVTLSDDGQIVDADSNKEWTQEQAHAVLLEINRLYPKESIWLETRIPRYVARTMYGDF